MVSFALQILEIHHQRVSKPAKDQMKDLSVEIILTIALHCFCSRTYLLITDVRKCSKSKEKRVKRIVSLQALKILFRSSNEGFC